METGSRWLIITLIFVAVAALAFFTYTKPTSTAVVETRNEHLVWSSKGCKVYQLVIKNEWGTYVLFITAPTLEETPLRQATYPTCRVTR